MNFLPSAKPDQIEVWPRQDQVNNADSAIIFLINHWSFRIVKVFCLVRVVEVVHNVQIVQVVKVVQGLKVSRSQGLKV